MQSTGPIRRDIVLVGGGHSHLAVLKQFGMRPEPGTRLTLITRDDQTPYSGMIPGYLAGRYARDVCHIDLGRLCRFAGARFYHEAATAIDLEAQLVQCADRPAVAYDLLSIDVGSAPGKGAIESGPEHAIPIKPIDGFLDRWQRVEADLTENAPERFRLLIIGAGAGGTELSLALRYRLNSLLARNSRTTPKLDVTIVTDRPTPLHQHAPAVGDAMRRVLRDRDIQLKTEFQVTSLTATTATAKSGDSVDFDTAVLVTEAAAAPWLNETGLALNADGFIRVDAMLRSISHPNVFAAGDVADFDGRGLAKSGVYAVRQGPALARNLRRLCSNQPLKAYRPQPRTLALISTGDGAAIASYGRLALTGPALWRFKDWIDRRWMRIYQDLPKMTPAHSAGAESEAAEDAAMRCGGCGGKMASPMLSRVLGGLKPQARADVLVGLDSPDDAAILDLPPGKLLVQTVDHFRAFIDDPYRFGRIAANHCLSDIYAMGAEPQAALAMVSLPYAAEAKMETDLRELLGGALEALNEAGAALIGGHTGEGAEMTFGLSVNGLADREALLRKGGMGPGDRLILTKALGTGALFAADMRAEADSRHIDSALAGMLRSNRSASMILQHSGATACTDVTGFGLAGHLLEMMRSAGRSVQLDLAALPALPGVLDLLERGITSTLHPDNLKATAPAIVDTPAVRDRFELLFDPQTAGGLLATIPADRVDRCLAQLAEAGDPEACVIGTVLDEKGAAPRIHLTERLD
jgi:selenide,water dikinase